MSLAAETIRGIISALEMLGLQAPLYLSQNDGTLMDSEFAARFPVLTIASGPTNSMRGAAFLSGVKDGIVVDIGGSSTDVGALVRGFPREASVAVEIAGVRTNFRMPDVLSIALGGGSVVRDGPLTIGPDSVGYRLTEEGMVFGGPTTTTTDFAVAAGMASLGNPERVSSLGGRRAQRVLEEIRLLVEECVDQAKTRPDPVPVVLVGGGSILVGESLNGASEVLRPEHAGVANAIGAAIAQVGAQVEKVFSLENIGRQEAIASIRAEAVGKVISAGAEPTSVEVVELDEVPLTYLPSNATRIRAKAAGDLADA
jgi:N-methylhydantoinase A/oxoprolinase/acetone carboxylase beta subunit